MANEHFGECLKHARAHKMMSQNRLVAATGMTQSAISNYEAGRAIPTEESAGRLATAMGLTLKVTDGNFYFAFPDSERLTEAQLRIVDPASDADGEEEAGDVDVVDAMEGLTWSTSVCPAENSEENAEIEKENLEEAAFPAPQTEKVRLITENMVARAALEQIRKEIDTYEQHAAEYGLSVGIASEALRGVISAVELMERLVGE